MQIVTYILIGALLVGMVAMMFVQGRRAKKEQSDYTAMLDTLRVGTKVKMVSGLLGRVKEIREEAPGFKTVVISTSEDKNAATMTFVIEAVQGIVNEEAINRMNLEKLAAEVDKQETQSTTEINHDVNDVTKKQPAKKTSNKRK